MLSTHSSAWAMRNRMSSETNNITRHERNMQNFEIFEKSKANIPKSDRSLPCYFLIEDDRYPSQRGSTFNLAKLWIFAYPSSSDMYESEWRLIGWFRTSESTIQFTSCKTEMETFLSLIFVVNLLHSALIICTMSQCNL